MWCRLFDLSSTWLHSLILHITDCNSSISIPTCILYQYYITNDDICWYWCNVEKSTTRILCIIILFMRWWYARYILNNSNKFTFLLVVSNQLLLKTTELQHSTYSVNLNKSFSIYWDICIPVCYSIWRKWLEMRVLYLITSRYTYHTVECMNVYSQ